MSYVTCDHAIVRCHLGKEISTVDKGGTRRAIVPHVHFAIDHETCEIVSKFLWNCACVNFYKNSLTVKMDNLQQLLDMNDTKCILVEFSNENGNVAVGYFNWLMNSNENNIQSIIKNSENVIIHWPKQCLIDGAVTKMKKRLQTCKWSMHVVKIIGFGG